MAMELVVAEFGHVTQLVPKPEVSELVTWPNSATTNSIAIPVDAQNLSVFFRLAYP